MDVSAVSTFPPPAVAAAATASDAAVPLNVPAADITPVDPLTLWVEVRSAIDFVV